MRIWIHFHHKVAVSNQKVYWSCPPQLTLHSCMPFANRSKICLPLCFFHLNCIVLSTDQNKLVMYNTTVQMSWLMLHSCQTGSCSDSLHHLVVERGITSERHPTPFSLRHYLTLQPFICILLIVYKGSCPCGFKQKALQTSQLLPD